MIHVNNNYRLLRYKCVLIEHIPIKRSIICYDDGIVRREGLSSLR